MYVKKIELQNFRNYETLEAIFDPKVNVFYGENAQGKTNLLEGIYMTSMGKSFRTNKDRDMIRFGSEFFRIKITTAVQRPEHFLDRLMGIANPDSAEKQEDENIVEMAVNQAGKKGIKINGMKVNKLADLFNSIYMVIFSPEDLKIVKDEPEKRRKFMDRELCQIKPFYLRFLEDYKRTLIQRNIYLKDPNIREAVLDVWDKKLAEYGSKIISHRNTFVKKLDAISNGIHSGITAGKENLRVSYESNIPVSGSSEDIEMDFYQELKNSRQRDMKNRTTSRGPHKDDLRLQAGGMDIRKFGSQGQQRTAALSLKLSEIKLIKGETGEYPVLLLDDVLSELDKSRQQYLISSLENVQIFITTTDLSKDVAEALKHIKYFHIKSGTVDGIVDTI